MAITTRTSAVRRVTIALVAGAGIALSPLPAQASTGIVPPSAAAPIAGPVAAATPAAQVIVDTALAQQGKPYAWGATGPGAFDCSGLTTFAAQAAGIALPRVSRVQATVGTPVSYDQLQPGDLVFFYSPVSHVGIYIGNGQMVHAPTSGGVVSVVDLAWMPGFSGATRIA